MGGKRFRTKAMRAQRVHISLLPLATLVSPILGQLQFNGGVSSSSNNNGNSANRNRASTPVEGGRGKPTLEERFFLPTGQGCTCNNGRRRRQAPGEDQPGTR